MSVGRALSEKELTRLVMGALRQFGWLAYHTVIAFPSEPGFPDIVAVRDGRMLFVELKSERGVVTEAQRQWLDALAAAGAEVYVWRPAQWFDDTIIERIRPGAKILQTLQNSGGKTCDT